MCLPTSLFAYFVSRTLPFATRIDRPARLLFAGDILGFAGVARRKSLGNVPGGGSCSSR
jgi:hypothetical protein